MPTETPIEPNGPLYRISKITVEDALRDNNTPEAFPDWLAGRRKAGQSWADIRHAIECYSQRRVAPSIQSLINWAEALHIDTARQDRPGID